MAIKFDNIEAESLLNGQGELTITLTDDQGITVPGAVNSASVTATGTVQGSYVTANNTSGAANGSAQEVARFVNTRSGATSGYIYIGAASGTDWRLGKNINGTASNTNFGITKHSGTDIFLEIDGSGNTSILGDVFSDGLYVNSTSAVSGTQVAIVADGNQNLQRWGSSSDGTTQASYRFRIDQNFQFIGNSGSGDTLTLDSTNGSATFTGSISASNFSGSSSGTNTGDQDLSSYLTSVAFSDLTSKPSTLSGYGITDGVSLGTDNVFTGDNEFEGDLLRTNQRIGSNQEYPLGHYTPGETVFELNTTWSNRELRQYFGNDSVSWDEVANAPGGYAVYINGSVSVGGAYNSGFPYIPIDQDGIYYMECWIKNAGTGQGHYMGSIDYQANFTNPSSGGGNPGSYGYFVMSNYTGASDWTKVSGYITGHHNSNTGAFETDATYWTPQALFNYSAGTGTRACWISGWKVIRVDHVGDRTFQDDVKVKGKLEVHTLDTNTASTTALVMNGNEVEKRTLGSNAFNSTSFLTSVDFTDIGGTVSSTGGATRTNYNLGFKPSASSYAGFRFYGADGNNAGYFLVRGTSDNGVYAANGITLVGDQGWLTLAHRYSSDKGIRFMTGNTSAPTRMTIASDGDININNSLTVGVDLAVTGNIKDNDYKHAGSDLWLTKKYVRSVGITGADIGNSWVQLSRVAIASSYGKLAAKFTIHGYDDVSSGTEVIDVIYENGNSAQENHGCQWYSTDNNANLFKAVRSIRSSSSGTDNTYDLYVQMNGDWRDTFTVVAEYWRTGTNQSISFITSAGSANEPSAGSDDIGHVERKWYTQNTYMYLGGSNRVYTTGDFTNNSSNWDTAHGWGNHASAGYLTAHPSITEAADVDNSGGTVIQDLTFDNNGHVTATGSVNLDNIYTSTDGTEDDYRFGLNLGSFTGTRWYKVATVNVGSGGLRIRGMMTNHVESFGSNMIDLAIQGREGNNSANIEITGHVHVLHENAGIAIYSGEKPSYYTHWDVYVVATQYTQCELDLTKVSGSFDTSGNYVTTEPTGTLELETYQLSEGNYVIRDSAAKRIFDQGMNLAGGLSYTPSTNTLTQTDNNTTYSAGTGLTLTNTTFSVTSGTYASASHNHNGVYLSTSGGEISQSTNTEGTTGTTLLTLTNDVGSDISQQQTFIDFKFTDTNANWTPQVRIGAQVGRDADANAISKEGAGAFVVYTGNGTDEGGSGSLTEAFRVSYDGNATVAGNISADNLVNATTSASGFMSSTDKTKLDGVATGADVTPSWVPANDPSYLTSLPSHNHDERYFRKYTGQATGISNAGYRTAFTVAGGNLASSIRFSVQGTTDSVVVSNVIDVIANHYQDILIEATSGIYTRLYVKVISNNNEDFAVELKTDHANAVTLDIEVLAYGNETVTFTTSHSFTGASLELDCEPGKTFKATGGDSGDIKTYGVFRGDGSGLTGSIKAATLSDQASPTATIQVGAGTSNATNRSGVALLGDANAGGVVNALGLINTAAAANSNGVALNFHNANNYSPTGQILLQQNSSGTTTHSAMKFFTYGSNNLTHQMSIKSDGVVRFLSYGTGILSTDANGNISAISDGTSGQVLTTDGSGGFSFTTVTSGSSYTLPTASETVLGGIKVGDNLTITEGVLSATDTDTVYVHPTSAGNKHIPTGGAAGQFLKYSSSGTAVWATPSYTTNTDTQYSAGTGLDLTGTTFSIESDLRDGVTRIGKDTSNYIAIGADTNVIDFHVGGVWVARMESDGDLHIKGDVIAFSNIFNP